MWPFETKQRAKPVHLIALAIFVVLLGVLAYVYGAAREAVSGLPETAQPTPQETPRTNEQPTDPESCAKAGGRWNECGSACPDAPPGTACIQVCMPRCEGLDDSTNVQVYIYFSNSTLDGNQECTNVFPVARLVPQQYDPPGFGLLELEELLRGPTPEEAANGYVSNIPVGTRLLSVDGPDLTFSDELDRRVAGSCRVQAIRAQVESTFQAALPHPYGPGSITIKTASKPSAETLQP